MNTGDINDPTFDKDDPTFGGDDHNASQVALKK
mgnify:CR=1 FL=1